MEHLPDDKAQDLFQAMRAATQQHNALADSDTEGIRRLREHVGDDMSYTEVPALDIDVHNLAALAEVGRHLTAEHHPEGNES